MAAEKESLPLTRHNFVDPSYVLDFMPDGFYGTPLEYSPLVNRVQLPNSWHAHHLTFQKNWHTQIQSGIINLNSTRNSKHNQALIRVREHNKLHDRYGPTWEYPSADAVERHIEEDSILDQLEVATVGVMYSRRAVEGSEDGPTLPYSRNAAARLGLFEELQVASLEDVGKIEVIPEIAVTSALERLALLTGDPGISAAASQRIKKDPRIFPTIIRTTPDLYKRAYRLWLREEAARRISIWLPRTVIEEKVAASANTHSNTRYDWSRHPVPAVTPA